MKNSFYRPHERVTQDGTLTDPVTGDVTTPPSMTKQEFLAECDINNILKQYSQTGMLNHISAKAAQGAYIDLPDQTDYQDALHTVQAGETAFMTLPAKIRDRFGNDPANFLEFCSDPANLEEMRTLGLRDPLPLDAAPSIETSPPPEEPPKNT